LENVQRVLSDGLCTGCGTCAGVCPTEAITMLVTGGLLLPRVEEEKCSHCGLCLKCCSGNSVDFNELACEIFGKRPTDVLLGNYSECYVGHSNDNSVRDSASSGGMVTELLVFALEKGDIDGALVTRMWKNRPLETEPVIARTREEIVSASKSKYCPAAPNELLRHILKEDGRFAFVGLPCHIHGLRKAEQNVKGLQEKIVLRIGVMCSHTVSFEGTKFLLRKLGKEEIRWPKSVIEVSPGRGHCLSNSRTIQTSQFLTLGTGTHTGLFFRLSSSLQNVALCVQMKPANLRTCPLGTRGSLSSRMLTRESQS
jgi:coenzyme F420 hydrogenase subunit beta